MNEPKYTARTKLFADGRNGYRLQIHYVLADGVDTGIEWRRECKAGVWTTWFDSDLGSFASLDAALSAKEQQSRDDAWDAAEPGLKP